VYSGIKINFRECILSIIVSAHCEQVQGKYKKKLGANKVQPVSETEKPPFYAGFRTKFLFKSG